jgi:hypothetical protein
VEGKFENFKHYRFDNSRQEQPTHSKPFRQFSGKVTNHLNNQQHLQSNGSSFSSYTSNSTSTERKRDEQPPMMTSGSGSRRAATTSYSHTNEPPRSRRPPPPGLTFNDLEIPSNWNPNN